MNICPPLTKDSNPSVKASGDVVMQRKPLDGSPVNDALPMEFNRDGIVFPKKPRNAVDKLAAQVQKISRGINEEEERIRAMKKKQPFPEKLREQLDDDNDDDDDDDDDHTNDASSKPKKLRRRWKKPKDKPKRPLSAYNLFFQAERAKMLGEEGMQQSSLDKNKKRIHRKSHGKIGFAEMARVIGSKWKTLENDKKKAFEAQANKEKKRYEVELEAWKAQKVKSMEAEAETHTLEATVAALERRKNQNKLLAAAISRQQTLNPSIIPQTLGNDSESALSKIISAESERQRGATLMQQQQNPSAFPGIGGMSSLDYLRALERRQMELTLLEQPPPAQGYPNAAAASANAIMQQFLQQQQLQRQQQERQQLQLQQQQLQLQQQQQQLRQNMATAQLGAGQANNNTQSELDRLRLLAMMYSNNIPAGSRQFQQQQQQQLQQQQELGNNKSDMATNAVMSNLLGGNSFRGM